jgi:hypothetical protein
LTYAKAFAVASAVMALLYLADKDDFWLALSLVFLFAMFVATILDEYMMSRNRIGYFLLGRGRR